MKELICITCPRGCRLTVDDKLNVSGNTCPRGEAYAKAELTNPVRMITTTASIISKEETRLPVRTSKPISKKLLFAVVEEIKKIEVKAPINIGDVVIKGVLGTDVDIISAKNVTR